jgi:hypothetical protein
LEPAIERFGHPIAASAGQRYGQNPAFLSFLAAFAGSGFTKNYALAWFDHKRLDPLRNR